MRSGSVWRVETNVDFCLRDYFNGNPGNGDLLCQDRSPSFGRLAIVSGVSFGRIGSAVGPAAGSLRKQCGKMKDCTLQISSRRGKPNSRYIYR